MAATTEHCGNCAHLRTTDDREHNVCAASAWAGFHVFDGGACVCANVTDETKPSNCPGWQKATTENQTKG